VTQAEATQIGIELIFYTSLAFCIAVSSFWAWWKSQLGWTIIAKSLCLAIATLPAMVFFWLGHRAPTWLEDVSIAGLWSVPVVLAWRAIVLWRVQRGYMKTKPPDAGMV
jgi:hypothetical protein